MGQAHESINHALRAYIGSLKDPKVASHEFEKNLMIAKVIFGAVILLAAMVNRDTDFMKKSPKGQNAPGLFFFYETLLFAVCGVLGFSFIGAMRSKKTGFARFDMKFAATVFVVFVLLNVMLQLSGVLTVALPKHKDEVLEEEYTKALAEVTAKKPIVEKDIDGLKTAVFILLGLVILYLVVLMIFISVTLRDTVVPSYGGSIFSRNGLRFWIEAFVFAATASFNFFASARWRTGKVDWAEDSKEVALMFVKFFILHILLQTSGVYNHILFPEGS